MGIVKRKPDCGRYLQQSQAAHAHGSFSTGGQRRSVRVPDLARDDIRS
jgi:hypothetical protein